VIGSVASQAQTAFDRRQHKEDQRAQQAPAVLGEASFAPVAVAPVTVAQRMHTLILTGSLDRASAHTLEVAIERLCEEGVTGITLDLRRLDHIDPIGAAVIAFRCGLCQRRGYDFALIRGSRSIGRAFEQAGVSDLLPFQDEPVAPERRYGQLATGLAPVPNCPRWRPQCSSTRCSASTGQRGGSVLAAKAAS